MAYEYGKRLIGMALGDAKLLTDADSHRGDPWDPWEPSVPEDTATLWRYMSFAKFCSLLERKELFFSTNADINSCENIRRQGLQIFARAGNPPGRTAGNPRGQQAQYNPSHDGPALYA